MTAQIPDWLPRGDTALIGMLGDPVRQVKLPPYLSRMLWSQGCNAVVVAMQVPVQEFARFMTVMKTVPTVVGHVLTVPHKRAGMAFADRISTRARIAGSVNVLRREADGSWTGDNFDGIGLTEGLAAHSVPLTGRTVFLAGAGGAGCGAAAALAEQGIARLRVYDPDRSLAVALSDRLVNIHPGLIVDVQDRPDPAGSDVAINASPLGMRVDDPLPFPVGSLDPGTVVAEFVMMPAVTPLLMRSAARGLKVVEGENVLQYQLEVCRDFFLASIKNRLNDSPSVD